MCLSLSLPLWSSETVAMRVDTRADAMLCSLVWWSVSVCECSPRQASVFVLV